MLKKVIVHGFKSHKHTEITLGSNITSFIGENGNGKSALFKAILWVMTNKPAGERFIHWELKNNEPAYVTLHWGEHVITRRKSRDKKINEYILNGITLSGFGQTIPLEIEQTFNLGDVNIQTQGASRYLLSETAAERARIINKMVNLEEIDKAYSYIDQEKRRNQSNIKALEKEYEAKEKDIEKVAFVPVLKDDVEELKYLHKEAEEIRTKLTLMQEYTKNYTDIQSRFLYLPKINMEETNEIISKVDKIHDTIQDLKSIVSNYTELELALKPSSKHTPEELYNISQEVDKEINKLEHMQNIKNNYYARELLPVSSVTIDRIHTVLELYKDEEKTLQEMQILNRDIGIAKLTLDKSAEAVKESKEKYEKEKPNTCPLCGSVLHKEEV